MPGACRADWPEEKTGIVKQGLARVEGGLDQIVGLNADRIAHSALSQLCRYGISYRELEERPIGPILEQAHADRNLFPIHGECRT